MFALVLYVPALFVAGGCWILDSGTDWELVQQNGMGVEVVRKWRYRSTVHDASHTAHRLQTTLNAAQEALVIYLRTQLLLLSMTCWRWFVSSLRRR